MKCIARRTHTSYEAFVNEVHNVLKQTLDKLGHHVTPTFEIPPQPDMGDIATAVAFEISKQLKANPTQIARIIAEKTEISNEGMIERVKSAGPYVNFYVKMEKLTQDTLQEIRQKGLLYGSSGSDTSRRVLVEHTNVNPNKAIHIGHTRNSCLGDSLARILRHNGQQVQVANYVDDSGTQVADIVLGFLKLGFSRESPNQMKFDQYCGDEVYVKVNRMYDKDPSLVELRREISKQIENGENTTADFAKQVTTRVLKAQLETCWRIGVYFDLINTESDILALGLSDSALEILKEIGMVTLEHEGKLAGCWILEATKIPRFAEETDAVLVRSDGTTTYLGKDLAYAMWKLGLLEKDFHYRLFGAQANGSPLWTTSPTEGDTTHPKFGFADKAISVIDVRQSRPQEIIRSCIVLIAKPDSPKEYVHYGYEVVSLSPKTASAIGLSNLLVDTKKLVHMQGRSGVFVNTDKVLGSLKEKAMRETAKRNTDANETLLQTIAEKIAVGALRYNLTKVDNDKIIVFDLDEALNLEGDTGPYIQYARVRAARIVQKSGNIDISNANASLLVMPEEFALLKQLARFPSIVQTAAKSSVPQKICKYSYALATLFNDFYEKHRVVGADTVELMKARLCLVECVKTVLDISMTLLGIPVVDQM